MKRFLLAVSVLAFAAPAEAHMVWLERNPPDRVRAYFGELDHREKTGAVLDRLVPLIFANAGMPLAQTRGADFIEVESQGDIRLTDERYPPFGASGKVMRPMMYARWGRAETNVRMAFEFVPEAPQSDRFTLLLDDKLLGGAEVTLIGPDGEETKIRTDDQGQLTVAPQGTGQFILHAVHRDRTPGSLDGKSYDLSARVTTLTFTRP